MDRFILLVALALAAAGCPGFGGPPWADDDDRPAVGDDDDGTPDEGGPAFALPSSDPGFVSPHFWGPETCLPCHDGMEAADGSDASIQTDWAATMMANAARDPYFRARVASETARNPGAEAVIEAKCAQCHAPMGYTEDVAEGGDGRLSDGGLFGPAHDRFDEAMGGVSCTVCHGIEDDPTLGTPDGFSGGYVIDDDATLYGPFDDPFPGPMSNELGIAVEGSDHVSQSRLCSTCHELDTPVFDDDGLTDATFTEQAVFSEWSASAYAPGETCQGCHMPPVDDAPVSTRPPWLDARDDVNRHWFVGANTLVLGMFRDHGDALGVASDGFETTIDRTRSLLESAATLSIDRAAREGDVVAIDVTVTSHTGHKLPTAYPSRRMWLHLQVSDGDGLVWESGAPAADGTIAGVDADADPAAYEPHHAEITDAAQVQVWEAIAHDVDGAVEYSLLRSAGYLKDNRLLPDGFDKAAAPARVAPVGAAQADADFVGGSDAVRYRIPGLPAGDLTVTATLRYQSISPGHVRDLAQDDEEHDVAAFLRLFEQAPERAGEALAQASRSL